MDHKHDQPTDGFGLLANGSSGGWSITVDESLDRDEWSLEIDGPQVYFVIQLEDLAVLRKALRFLEAEVQSPQGRPARGSPVDGDALVLGRFGPASVSLVRDNEGFPR